jgi:hypothetical protein
MSSPAPRFGHGLGVRRRSASVCAKPIGYASVEVDIV